MRTTTRNRKTILPKLEQLEARMCPAFNIYYYNSALIIRGQPTHPFVNPGDGLQLQLLANGSVRVREVSGSTIIDYGSYRPTPNIQIILNNNTDHDFTFDLGTGDMPGNVLLNLGKGNTDVLSFPPHPDTFLNGSIGGNVTILGGSGGELIDLGTSEGVSGTSNEPIQIGGNTTLSLSSAPTLLGGDFLNINAGSDLLGGLTGNEVDNIDIGEQPVPLVNTGSAFVRGDVAMNVSQSGNVGKLDIFGEVDGNVNFQGSPVQDPFFSDAVVVESGGLVQGNLTAALGNGTGTFNLLGTLQQNVSFTGALGDNFVGLSGSVAGSVQMNLRTGNNTLQFTGNVYGDLGVTAANGDNDLTLFTGAVAGNLALNLGNGSNTAILANAPQGQLSWTSGNGVNSLTLGSAATTGSEVWNANVQFGNNDDVFVLAGTPPGTTQTLSGLVNGGGRFTANTFTQSSNWVLQSNITLANFP